MPRKRFAIATRSESIDDDEEQLSLDSNDNDGDDSVTSDSSVDENGDLEGFLVNDSDVEADMSVAQIIEMRSELADLGVVHRAILERDPRDAFAINVEYCTRALLDPHFQERVARDKHSADFQYFFSDAASRAWYAGTDRCDSFMHSQVWTDEFHATIDSRPFVEIATLDTRRGRRRDKKDHGDCQVCRRRDHRATYSVTFYGEAYDPDVMLACEDNAERSLIDYERKARPCHLMSSVDDIPIREQRTFKVGAKCTERIKIYHQLRHFALHMLLTLRDQLNKTRSNYNGGGGGGGGCGESALRRNDAFHALYESHKTLLDCADGFTSWGMNAKKRK